MEVAKAEIVNHPVIRLTVELSNTHAAELAGLLSCHVSFFDFPWAKSIYHALRSAGIQDEDVFRDAELGAHAFLERRSDKVTVNVRYALAAASDSRG